MTATTATQDDAGRNGIGGNTGPNTRHWRAPQFFELPADEAAQLREPLLSEEKPVNPFNGGPDVEGQKQSIRTRWAKALFTDPDTLTYVIAMAWVISGTAAMTAPARPSLINSFRTSAASLSLQPLRAKNGFAITAMCS